LIVIAALPSAELEDPITPTRLPGTPFNNQDRHHNACLLLRVPD